MKKSTLFLLLAAMIYLLQVTGCKKSATTDPVLPPPTITAINPVSGAANTPVTITGTNFSTTLANNTVKFNGIAAVVTSANATSLLVTAPAAGTTGPVTVKTANGTANGPAFTYVLVQPPAITSISPVSGSAGTLVTITGINFKTTPADNTVKFNGVAATVQTATSTSITVIAPPSGTSGNVTCTTADGVSNGIVFTYTTGPDIYVSGTDVSGYEGYWKNSIFNKITDCNDAKAITGSANDIYIAGSSSTLMPTYWKNGTGINLDSRTGFTNAIFIAGTDVYTTGMITNLPISPNYALKYWKNATGYDLTAPNGGNVSSIFVSGSDVYVAGFQIPGLWKACYWKNGSPVDLTTGTTVNAQANAIYVSGTDVYVAGTEEELSGGGIVNKAPRLWKNGVSIPLTTPANSLFNDVSSVLVTGSDVYVGGQYNGAGAVWKNGTMINAAAYAVAEKVGSLVLFNNDLYATGSAASSGLNGYWKNGSFTQMSPGCGSAGPGCAGTSSIGTTGIYIK